MEHEYSCIVCGESKARVFVRKIEKNKMELTAECTNCLCKLFVDGNYMIIPFKNTTSDEQKGV